MEKKYELTDETIKWYGKTLHRIKALKDFGNIKEGDLGGYIEKEDNLSHNNDCWICGNAQVFGNAEVYGNAQVFGNAEVYGNTQVFGDAEVYGNAQVFGSADVFGNALVFGDAEVCGDAQVFGNAIISSNDDYITFGNIGSRYDTTTMFRCKDNMIYVSCGCFSGTLDEFHDRVIETHGDNKYAKVYNSAISMAKLYFGIE